MTLVYLLQGFTGDRQCWSIFTSRSRDNSFPPITPTCCTRRCRGKCRPIFRAATKKRIATHLEIGKAGPHNWRFTEQGRQVSQPRRDFRMRAGPMPRPIGLPQSPPRLPRRSDRRALPPSLAAPTGCRTSLGRNRPMQRFRIASLKNRSTRPYYFSSRPTDGPPNPVRPVEECHAP